MCELRSHISQLRLQGNTQMAGEGLDLRFQLAEAAVDGDHLVALL